MDDKVLCAGQTHFLNEYRCSRPNNSGSICTSTQSIPGLANGVHNGLHFNGCDTFASWQSAVHSERPLLLFTPLGPSISCAFKCGLQRAQSCTGIPISNVFDVSVRQRQKLFYFVHLATPQLEKIFKLIMIRGERGGVQL